jgi:hypothetical protein
VSTVLAGLVGALAVVAGISLERWLVDRRDVREAKRRAYSRVLVASMSLVKASSLLWRATRAGDLELLGPAEQMAGVALDDLNAATADLWTVGSPEACGAANAVLEKCVRLTAPAEVGDHHAAFAAFAEAAGHVSESRMQFVAVVRDELGLVALGADELGIDAPDWSTAAPGG